MSRITCVILYKYGPVMRVIWSFMDLWQQYWPRQSWGQYCCWRFIKPTLPEIIGQYLLYYMSNVYSSNHFLFYSLGHGVTIVKSYCRIITSNKIVAPEWHFYQTIVQYDVTIIQYNVTIIKPFNIGKYLLVNMVFGVSMHHYWGSCDQESTNQL